MDNYSNDLNTNLVNSDIAVNQICSYNGQTVLIEQSGLTSELVNKNLSVNDLVSDNEQENFTSQNQLSTKFTQISSVIGLASAAILILLCSIVGGKGGYIRTHSLARDLKMSYQALLKHIEKLNHAGYIISHPGKPSDGRCVEFTSAGQLDLASYFNSTVSDSSCSYNLKTTTTNNSLGQLSLTSPRELIEEADCFVQDDLANLNKNIDQLQFANMAPWEKSKYKNSAEELFYLGLIAKFNLDLFSKQTLNLYEALSKEKGSDHASAIFLILLPKVKSNHIGYINSALNQGAAPTTDSLNKVRDMRQVLGCLSNTSHIRRDLKQQMLEAIDQSKMEILSRLTQEQVNIEKALKLLSWKETLEALIERREKFTISLLQ